jgi:hypothetical protein
LRGVEQEVLLLEGSCTSDVLPGAASVEVERVDGAAQVQVYVFSMVGLSAWGIGPRWSYREALWRYRARESGRGVWVNLRCDLDAPLVRLVARPLMRYQTEHAHIELAPGVEVRATEGRLAYHVTGQAAEPYAYAPRAMLTWFEQRLYELPWGVEAPRSVDALQISVEEDSLSARVFGGSVTWARAARLRDRPHACGLARACG